MFYQLHDESVFMTKAETIGDRIKRLRKAQNLSQVQLARRVHLSDSYISFLESNSRRASPEVLHRLAAFFEVDPTFLRHGNRRQQALEAALEQLDEQRQRAVQAVNVIFAKTEADDVVTCQAYTLLKDGMEVTTLTITRRYVSDRHAQDTTGS